MRAIDTSKLCPQMRFFESKIKKRLVDTVGQGRKSRARDRLLRQNPPGNVDPDICAPLAAREMPARSTKKGCIAEYYDFSTSRLDIEVQRGSNVDPFVEPQETGAPHVAASHRPTDDAPYTTDDKGGSEGASRCVDFSASENAAGNEKEDSARHDDHSLVQECKREPEGRAAASRPSITPDHRNLIENPAESATGFRTSLTLHARALFIRQHRVFLFQVIIFNGFARFIRWDRSGAVVTARFDYVADSHLLAEFFWRFAHMNHEQRGFDPSVTLASSNEAKLLADAVQEYLTDVETGVKNGRHVRSLPGVEMTLDESYPSWKIHVADSISRKSTELIVRSPFSLHSRVFGRSTRAYIAFDLTSRHLVFLKDGWRIDHPKLVPESKIFRELKKHGVPYMPTVLYGGDVRSSDRHMQQTLTNEAADDEAPWRTTDGRCELRFHHRIVQEIAYPLETAVDEREFIQAIHDVLCGMRYFLRLEFSPYPLTLKFVAAIERAYDSAGYMHRDISVGNIMLAPDGKAVLNDWDHAGNRDDLTLGAVGISRLSH